MSNGIAIKLLLAFFIAIALIASAILGNLGSMLGSIIDTEDMIES